MKRFMLLLLLSTTAAAQCPSSWTCNIVVTPVTDTSVTVTWNTATATTGQVRYGLTGTYGKRSTLVSTPALAHSATLTGLTSGTLYYFQTLQKDGQGIQVNSLQGTFTAGQVSVSHTVDLNWVASTSSNIAGYNVYRSTDQVVWTRLNPSLIASTLYTDSAVTSGQTYYYEATAVDITNLESAPSNVATAQVP